MKYVPSMFIGQLSRSQGSTTASHNRFGSYFRNRTIPVNPNTGPQSVQRNEIQELSQNYKNLTEAERLGWKNLGEQMLRLDSQGQSYNLTGLQAYISVNRNLGLLGSARVTAAPTLQTPTTITSGTLTATQA